MTQLDKTEIAGDVVRWFDDDEYVLESCVLKNEGAAAYTDFDIAGHPVKITGGVAALIEVGLLNFDQADTNGIIPVHGKIASLAAGASTTDKYPILKRGPAVIWEDGMPANDASGTAFTPATLITAYEGLSPPIEVKPSSSALSSTHTT